VAVQDLVVASFVDGLVRMGYSWDDALHETTAFWAFNTSDQDAWVEFTYDPNAVPGGPPPLGVTHTYSWPANRAKPPQPVVQGVLVRAGENPRVVAQFPVDGTQEVLAEISIRCRFPAASVDYLPLRTA